MKPHSQHARDVNSQGSRSAAIAQHDARRTGPVETWNDIDHPNNSHLVKSVKEQHAETLLKRLKYLDNILNSPNISLESIREAQREKTQIYDGIAD